MCRIIFSYPSSSIISLSISFRGRPRFVFLGTGFLLGLLPFTETLSPNNVSNLRSVSLRNYVDRAPLFFYFLQHFIIPHFVPPEYVFNLSPSSYLKGFQQLDIFSLRESMFSIRKVLHSISLSLLFFLLFLYLVDFSVQVDFYWKPVLRVLLSHEHQIHFTILWYYAMLPR